jgi:serine O-acetyltransferase
MVRDFISTEEGNQIRDSVSATVVSAKGADHSTTRNMVFKRLGEQIDVVMEHDPAARSRLEVVLCYPGFHALLFYRLAHFTWRQGLPLLGRLLSHIGRVLTGIEIHPAARIGERLFIDHGMGVVIGATTEIGDDVTLYQGVTLGGTTLERGVKRHPTLEKGVIVGAGAKVLGPITVGPGARIGSNAVVVKDVVAGATIVGVPGKEITRRKRQKREAFMAYGTPDDIPDPVARALDGLLDQFSTLQARIERLESAEDTDGDGKGSSVTTRGGTGKGRRSQAGGDPAETRN